MATLGQGIADITLQLPDEIQDRVEVKETIAEDGSKTVDVAVNQTVLEARIDVASGSTTNVSGTKVKASKVVAAAEAGETTEVTFDTKVVKNSKITVNGEGAGDVSFEEGTKVKGTKIKFKEESNDSVSFADGTLVKNVKVNVGDGDDTITFGDVKLKGESVVKLGDGKDVLEISSDIKAKKNATITVKNFDEDDKVIVDGVEVDAKQANDDFDFLVIKGLD